MFTGEGGWACPGVSGYPRGWVSKGGGYNRKHRSGDIPEVGGQGMGWSPKHIWSASERYASYWNAFLLHVEFRHNKDQNVKCEHYCFKGKNGREHIARIGEGKH